MDFMRSLCLVILLVCLLSGCASSSVFNPYPNQANDYRQAVANDTINTTTSALIKKENDADALLYLSERGRLNQLNKDYAASKADFEKVIATYDMLDERATVSASSLAANASTLLTNDNAIPYEGFGYERIFAHQFQAFNYLALRDIEGANVELRRAAEEQRRLELLHDKEITEAEQASSENRLNPADWENTPELAGMNVLAGNVKSSFQNAYTFYTSAVLWEAQGDFNNALVDYKKALEINPDNVQIQQDVVRATQGKKLAANEASLVVLFEDGWVPARQSFNLSIPYFTRNDFSYLSIAFPYYTSSNWPSANTLTIYHNHQNLGQPQQVANVGAMAVKALKEKVPGMVVRQVLRAKAKYETNQAAARNAGLIGSLVATIYNVVSEQADLRSWLTLPNNAQVLRTPLTPGEQNIELSVNGMSQTVSVNMRGGKTTILRIIQVNNRLYYETFNL